MTVYCVSYDLNKTGQNYNALYEELKDSPSWWHHLDSTWLIYTSETEEELSARLLKHLDSDLAPVSQDTVYTQFIADFSY